MTQGRQDIRPSWSAQVVVVESSPLGVLGGEAALQINRMQVQAGQKERG